MGGAVLQGLGGNGTVSANGSCRLLSVADGVIALNLPRASDWDLLAAWLQSEQQEMSWEGVAEAVAEGDLSQRIDASGQDETGRLLASLQRMTQGLSQIVSEVRTGSESIATGSSQIAVGSSDLSQRTEEQASNLQQTAASMEELTATVKHNADTARAANMTLAGFARGDRLRLYAPETMPEPTVSEHTTEDHAG